jgi:DNA-binding MarR family transcriptional regulator
MAKRKNIDQQMIDNVAQNMFHALPLLRKRLLHMDVVQTAHGIPLSHVQVLSMLNAGKSMSVSDISHRLGIAKPNITPLVDRLLERGLVQRQRDAGDRRVVNVLITPEGIRTLAAIQNTIANQVRIQSEHLSSAEFKELDSSLESITRILSSL